MHRRGTTQQAIEKALLEENKRCAPPLGESEVKRIATSIGRYPPTLTAGESVPVPGVRASSVKAERVRWLWNNYVPLGKITVFDWEPGVGKSTLALDLAARVPTGRAMPDGSECGCPPAGVVIVSLEDGIADTIMPRLAAAHADLTRVQIIDVIKGPDGVDRTPTIPVDLPAIEAAIRDVNAALLVLDPVVRILSGETDSCKDQQVRRALAPVNVIAEKAGLAVIVIRHITKGGGTNPKYRGAGTIGFTELGRAEFLFAEDPNEESSFVMAWVKGNLAARPTSRSLKALATLAKCQGLL